MTSGEVVRAAIDKDQCAVSIPPLSRPVLAKSCGVGCDEGRRDDYDGDLFSCMGRWSA